MSNAGIYVRISDDTEGLRAGVRRQAEDCRELCELLGWRVVDLYEDNDRSAYRGKRRPQYERMLADIAGGRIDAVVAWHVDRLTRHPRELEEFIEMAEHAGVQLATFDREIDLSTKDGQFHARILGAVARKESDDKSRRIRRKHEELAREGKVGGGGHRPFGFETDRVTVNAVEASLIREAVERLLLGESIRSVLRLWEQEGVVTPTGGYWSPPAFKRMILSPRICGLREHRGEVVGEAVWPGIIDEVTHNRLLRKLEGRVNGRTSSRRKYLLTGGLSVCGLCGARLVARPRDGRRSMVCATGPGLAGCGGIRVVAEPFEEFIRSAVIKALDGPGLVQVLNSDGDDTSDEAKTLEEIGRLREQLEQAAADFYADDPLESISRAEFFAARRVLENKIEEAKSRLGTQTHNRVLASLPSGRSALETAWESADLSWRRALVSAVIDHVVVGPAVRGRNYFDADRLEIRWHA